jgi:hypothetical protein
MSTTSQLFANRINCLKSTGPRTIEGKLISSRNGVSHGLSSVGNPVLAHEDRDAYNALLKSLQSEHSPATEHEEYLVTQMAGARWRADRAERIEQLIYEGVDFNDASNTHPDFRIAKIMLEKAGDPIDRLERHKARLESTYLRFSRELRATQKANKEPTAQKLAEAKYNIFMKSFLEHNYNGPALNKIQSEADFDGEEEENDELPTTSVATKANNGHRLPR